MFYIFVYLFTFSFQDGIRVDATKFLKHWFDDHFNPMILLIPWFLIPWSHWYLIYWSYWIHDKHTMNSAIETSQSAVKLMWTWVKHVKFLKLFLKYLRQIGIPTWDGVFIFKIIVKCSLKLSFMILFIF